MPELAPRALDGKKCSVNFRVSPKKVYPTTLKQLARELRVPLEQLDDVLDDWTHEQLVAHLSQFPSEVLDSLPQEELFVKFLAERALRQRPPAALGFPTRRR